MIHESVPWKDSLARDADIIERWARKPKVTARRSVLIEQKVFLAAYSMRKLSQAGKLSSSFDGFTVPCQVSPLREGKKIDQQNAHRFSDLYDFDKMVRIGLSAPALLDVLIHSLLFAEAISEGDEVTGFFVTSDHHRSNVWLVEIDFFIKLMRRVASDYPSQGHWARNLETGEYIDWRGDREPPSDIRAKMDRIVQSNRKGG